jgi:hypothetical protein
MDDDGNFFKWLVIMMLGFAVCHAAETIFSSPPCPAEVEAEVEAEIDY